ncbi:MAG: hypothetical protein QOK03_289 [Candidatus Binataceae bacterium]|jgi:hypothetical protein|nr:hypothetical protein [Candidatus Binataceae bacterium]
MDCPYDSASEDLGNIVALEHVNPLFTIEHEVRSMKHPLYMRPLVNRNPAQSNINYMPGHDAWV